MTHQSPAEPVATGDVVELSFHHAFPNNGSRFNPFFDAAVEADFLAPDGRTFTRPGFYHSADTWAVRFRPDRPGEWKYRYRFSSGERVVQSGEGRFLATPASFEGRVRVHPNNPYRWIFENGRPYFPIGMQDCVGLKDGHLGVFGVDGEGRNDQPRGLSPQQYFALYGQAGFNLLRFSQRNCSYEIYDDLDHYNVTESLATDELLQTARANGFRVMFGIFGYHAGWNRGSTPKRAWHYLREKLGLLDEAITNPGDKVTLHREERFADYCIARWGVYADFWELLNERKASDEWTRLMAAHVQAVDPDRKPVATSWEKPEVAEIGITSPHWYESESELNSDRRIAEVAHKFKAFGKPVLVGEQGNMGMNWDPLSATRMRLRTWTSMFQEMGLVFWNISWSKAGVNGGRYTPGTIAGMYLGPEERGYIAVLQGFASRLDADVRMTPVEVSPPWSVRAYGLASPNVLAVYLHHFTDHSAPLKGTQVKIGLPVLPGLRFEWIDPGTGAVLAQGTVRPEQTEFGVPPFSIDLAMLVAEDGIPKNVSLPH